MRLIGGLHCNDRVFIRVCSITLVMEYFLERLDSLAELYNIVDYLGVRVKSLHEYLFLTLVQKYSIDDIDYFVIR